MKTGKWNRKIRAGLAVLLSLTLLLVPTSVMAAELSVPTAQVTGGKISGSRVNGVAQFLGIPYAEASERFTPAGPVKPWKGTRKATTYGKISYQSGMMGQTPAKAGPNESNNAQNLNIWTPDMDNAKRPVMVWLHGGGFSTGSANEEQFVGDQLSKRQDVVVVGVNHRLGVYGHLDLSAYGSKYKYSENVGMMDIVDALKWVHNNIVQFGGDPDNVTLFGQSGGGAKVLAMMATPYANGLFERGIVESGATEGMGPVFTSKKISQDLGQTIVKNLGLSAKTLDKIQNVSNDQLMDAATRAQRSIARKYKIPVSVGAGYASEWEPVIDGDFLPQNPVQDKGFADNAKQYPLLIGSNLNEWNLYMRDVLQHNNLTPQVNRDYAAAYPNEDPTGAEELDTLIRLPILKITAHKADQGTAPVYSYIFTKQIGDQGVYHGAEIPFVFEHADDWMLADTVAGYFTSFARNGVPSVPGKPAWEPYTRQTGAVMILDDITYLTHHHDEKLMKELAPDYRW